MDPAESDEVAEAIRRLVVDPQLREAMSRRKLEAAATRLGWDRAAATLVSLVEEALRQ